MELESPQKTAISDVHLKQFKKEELLRNLDFELKQRLEQIESYFLLLRNTLQLCGEMRLSRVPRAIRNTKLRDYYKQHNIENKENKPESV
ncbi:hypothetical protein PNEG_02821 [Pneumocystis murina B123]|uniref:Borealin N-terminal domain-containing protein n=1 Tax=Pneumocystis murina (strain B123) TaxID=1069680 RepID=M7PF10_PNEMU|nr:hypothetical protein PNEG_02821 [Pneumocystis murina B123]EMR09049.1 hypothetical protein PNEG_02821 [Pneumocystis murina B123]